MSEQAVKVDGRTVGWVRPARVPIPSPGSGTTSGWYGTTINGASVGEWLDRDDAAREVIRTYFELENNR